MTLYDLPLISLFQKLSFQVNTESTFAMTSQYKYDEKPEIQHLENEPIDEKNQHENPIPNLELGNDPTIIDQTLQGHGLLKSRFDDLSLWRTLWVFRRSALITLAVYTGYMCEGFEVSLSVHRPTKRFDFEIQSELMGVALNGFD